ncbi:MAG: serine hydrolase domain-containing protein [Planctomycetaceae bacterium]
MKPRSSRRRTILSVLAVLLLVVFVGGYFAFEPEVTWFFGWQDVPEHDVTFGEHTAVPGNYAEVIDFANTHLEQQKREKVLPALSVAIGLNGDVLWARAMGPKTLEGEGLQQPIGLNDRFRIGSIAKAITGTIAAKLVQDGQLDLDASVHKYVPYYPKKQHEISPRQLLTHTSGTRNYTMRFAIPANEFASRTQYDSVQAAVDIFKDDPLEFAPGTDFKYSVYGYVLASAVLEGASDLDFPTLVKTKLTEPLGLTNTMIESEAAGQFVAPYEFEDGRYKPALVVNTSNKLAAGGFVSTPTDLVRMANAILTGTYLAEDTTQQLLYEPQKLTNGEVNPQSYALGWRNTQSEMFFDGDRKIHIVHHGGMAMGSTAFLVMFPEYNLCMAVATNRSMGSSAELLSMLVPIAEKLIVQIERQRAAAN